jgi:hypothetical protein
LAGSSSNPNSPIDDVVDKGSLIERILSVRLFNV